jgi:hypothetical protein
MPLGAISILVVSEGAGIINFGGKQVYTFKCTGTLPAGYSLWDGAPTFYENGLEEYD